MVYRFLILNYQSLNFILFIKPPTAAKGSLKKTILPLQSRGTGNITFFFLNIGVTIAKKIF